MRLYVASMLSYEEAAPDRLPVVGHLPAPVGAEAGDAENNELLDHGRVQLGLRQSVTSRAAKMTNDLIRAAVA